MAGRNNKASGEFDEEGDKKCELVEEKVRDERRLGWLAATHDSRDSIRIVHSDIHNEPLSS